MKASNTSTIRKQPYKAVISVSNIDSDRTLKGRILMSCDPGNGFWSELAPVPSQFPLILDISQGIEKIDVKFYLNDAENPREICSGCLIVPADIAYNVEINTSSRIFQRIYGVHALDDMLGVDFKLTFVNTILFEKQGEPLPQTIGPNTRGDTTPLHLRISPSHPRKNKVFKYDEAMIHDYTCRVIGRTLGNQV